MIGQNVWNNIPLTVTNKPLYAYVLSLTKNMIYTQGKKGIWLILSILALSRMSVLLY